ncbi:hypothetical protein CRYUN_Cryun03dG0099400 [Craigia yunnanensis]
MPTLNLYTNVPVDAVTTSDILKDATKAVAKIIGKPESYVMILVNGEVPMAFAGTEAPAAYGELISIGGLGPSVNGKLSSNLADILQTKLSIDSSRFYIKFYDVQSILILGLGIGHHISPLAVNGLIGVQSAHSLDLMVRLSEWFKQKTFSFKTFNFLTGLNVENHYGKHCKLNHVCAG